MTECLSCGHLRHDLELNCPKCGSFYSTMQSEFASPNECKKTSEKLAHKIKTHLLSPKYLGVAIGLVIFLVILLGMFP
jgi:uncharacterized membrane protein YvbJ